MISDLPIATRLLPIREVAERLDLSKSKTVQLIRDGELDVRKLGRRVVVPDTAIATFITSLPSAKREG
jgi:excisionase family DNA binding protein